MNIEGILNTGNVDANDMENMDVSLNYDNPELMSSDFFDSVLSLENNLDEGLFSNFDDDVNLSSDTSHSDDVLSPQSFSSESDKNSTYGAENVDESASVISSIDSLDDPILLSLFDPTTDVKLNTEELVPLEKISRISTTSKPTKILIQNPSNKKFIAKPIISASQIRKNHIKGKTQILKVQQVTNSGRPVLLPLSVKSIKILNTTTADVAALTCNIKSCNVESAQALTGEKVVSSTTGQYPALHLTAEEKRLLAKEGIQLPTHHPLTKNEERELKRIRRKIRNKISAQDSRKRKKEYVDGLEERVKRGSEENKNLLQRVKELQRQNRSLIAHVNKLQALICNSTTTKATPSTCLMVVLLSALLVSLPNMKLFENKQLATEQEQISIRRSLLSSPVEDDLNMEEFLVFKDEDGEFEGKIGEEIADIENSTEKEISKILKEMESKYNGLMTDNNNSQKGGIFSRMLEAVGDFLNEKKPPLLGKGAFHNKRGFIEPDVDDYMLVDEGPPLKRSRLESGKGSHIGGPPENDQVLSATLNAVDFNSNAKDK